jgi:PKD repeat protein
LKKSFVYLSLSLLLISCKDDDNTDVTPKEVNASFTASAQRIEEGASIDFTDQSTNNPTSWKWEFEGGTPATSEDQNPTVAYNEWGSYKVKLTASNADGDDIEEKSGYIEVLPSGLVCYYPLNGDALDFSKKANNGESKSLTYGEDRAGNSNSALTFGGNEYFDASAAVDDLKGNDAGTIMFWYKPSTATPGDKMNLFSASSTNNKFSTMFATHFESGETSLTHWKDDVTRMYGGFFEDFTFTSSDWHHMAYVQNGSVVELYVDGVKKSHAYSGEAPRDRGAWFNDIEGFDVFYFGVQYSQMNGFQRYMTGSMDEIQVYQRALSKDEIDFLKGL